METFLDGYYLIELNHLFFHLQSQKLQIIPTFLIKMLQICKNYAILNIYLSECGPSNEKFAGLFNLVKKKF
jgi:hypothetical protein